jgi:AbrB family looped-hinge helix DNA binding protein
MDKLLKSVEVHLGRQGRLVIPASLRRSLELEEGDKLIAREEEGRLILEKQNTVKQRLKNRFTNVSKKRSLASELIIERREAVKEEATE